MAANITIKQEQDSEASQLNISEIETRIVQLCQQFPKGVLDKVLENDMPGVNRVPAINRLLNQGKINVLRSKNKELLYILNDKAANIKLKGGEVEERVVFKIIEEAGNKGIWLKDIRYKSNLNSTTLTKIIKALEGKKLIKAITSVSAAKKKLYMLYNLEPDRSITGGAWYSQDQEYDSEFVDMLNQQCHRQLAAKAERAKETQGGPLMVWNASFMKSKEICQAIQDLQISKVPLSLEDVELILDTLVYDGKVEKSIAHETGGEQMKMYRAIESLLPSAGFVRIPCGICMVINSCGAVGSVRPQSCVYYNEWFD